MALQSATLMGMMHEKMSWLSQRQKVLAENIANANTPDFIPSDLEDLDFKRALNSEMRRTGMMASHERHFTGGSDNGSYKFETRKAGFSQTIDGNGVILEEQVMKLNATHGEHNLASQLYKKYVSLYKTAVRGQ